MIKIEQLVLTLVFVNTNILDENRITIIIGKMWDFPRTFLLSLTVKHMTAKKSQLFSSSSLNSIQDQYQRQKNR